RSALWCDCWSAVGAPVARSPLFEPVLSGCVCCARGAARRAGEIGIAVTRKANVSGFTMCFMRLLLYTQPYWCKERARLAAPDLSWTFCSSGSHAMLDEMENVAQAVQSVRSATSSPLAAVPLAPKDPILGLSDPFAAAPNPKKVNLGVGVYYDDTGKIPLLECVRKAERQLAETAPSRGYLPIDGLPVYA